MNIQRNSLKNQEDCLSPQSGPCQALQLAFGSDHPGVCNMLFLDGHVEAIPEEVDAEVWSDYGTRAGQTISESTGGANRD